MIAGDSYAALALTVESLDALHGAVRCMVPHGLHELACSLVFECVHHLVRPDNICVGDATRVSHHLRGRLSNTI